MTLQCNIISHCLATFTKWSLWKCLRSNSLHLECVAKFHIENYFPCLLKRSSFVAIHLHVGNTNKNSLEYHNRVLHILRIWLSFIFIKTAGCITWCHEPQLSNGSQFEVSWNVPIHSTIACSTISRFISGITNELPANWGIWINWLETPHTDLLTGFDH